MAESAPRILGQHSESVLRFQVESFESIGSPSLRSFIDATSRWVKGG